MEGGGEIHPGNIIPNYVSLEIRVAFSTLVCSDWVYSSCFNVTAVGLCRVGISCGVWVCRVGYSCDVSVSRVMPISCVVLVSRVSCRCLLRCVCVSCVVSVTRVLCLGLVRCVFVSCVMLMSRVLCR